MAENPLPKWATPSCENLPALSFTYGAVSVWTGLDGIFAGLGATPMTHHALAAVIADSQCLTGTWMPKRFPALDQQLGGCIVAGILGGYVGQMMMGR